MGHFVRNTIAATAFLGTAGLAAIPACAQDASHDQTDWTATLVQMASIEVLYRDVPGKDSYLVNVRVEMSKGDVLRAKQVYSDARAIDRESDITGLDNSEIKYPDGSDESGASGDLSQVLENIGRAFTRRQPTDSPISAIATVVDGKLLYEKREASPAFQMACVLVSSPTRGNPEAVVRCENVQYLILAPGNGR